MTHAVVWIDHKEARIFHVHPEAADESTILSPQHHIHRHPKGRGSRESTRMMRSVLRPRRTGARWRGLRPHRRARFSEA